MIFFKEGGKEKVISLVTLAGSLKLMTFGKVGSRRGEPSEAAFVFTESPCPNQESIMEGGDLIGNGYA
jgi:hypothetical protein